MRILIRIRTGMGGISAVGKLFNSIFNSRSWSMFRGRVWTSGGTMFAGTRPLHLDWNRGHMHAPAGVCPILGSVETLTIPGFESQT